MRLERIQAVRAEDHHAPAGSQHAVGFAQRRLIVCNVFQHLVQKDNVEGAIREGKPLSDSERQVRHRFPAFGYALPVHVDARNARRELPQSADEGADAAAYVENAFVFEVHVTAHDFEPPLETPSPHLARVAQSGALIRRAKCAVSRHRGRGYV